MTLVHQHVLIRAFVKDPPMTEDVLKQWFRDLVDAIKMKICIEPQAKYVEAVGNRGVTGLIGIETSHCSLHCWDESDPALIQMDVYSCSNFNTETIVEHLSKFGLVQYELLHIDRELEEFVILEHYKKQL